MSEITNAELARRLDRMESKLDRVLADHEDRLRRAERWMYTSCGLAAAAVVGAGSTLFGVVL